jgi:hypothetical protein
MYPFYLKFVTDPSRIVLNGQKQPAVHQAAHISSSGFWLPLLIFFPGPYSFQATRKLPEIQKKITRDS